MAKEEAERNKEEDVADDVDKELGATDRITGDFAEEDFIHSATAGVKVIVEDNEEESKKVAREKHENYKGF